MKTLVTILKSIFTPFSAFAFLLLGLLACFVSGTIEMFVLREILNVPGLGINATSWAILVVLVLEGSKFTLHFYAEALKRRGLEKEIDDFDIKKKRKLIERVKNSLVVLSLVCSLICIVNILYNDNDKKIEEYVQERDVYCDGKLEEGIQELEKKIAAWRNNQYSKYATMEKDIADQETVLAELEEVIKNEVYIHRRQDLQEEAESMRTQIATQKETYQQYRDAVDAASDKKYEEEYAILEAKYGDNGTERVKETDPAVLMEGDNPYLSGFLNAFTQTFLGTGYNRITYFICTIFISLIVAVVLELCINISQSLLTIKAESFVKIIGEMPKLEKGKKVVHLVVWLMFSVLIATAMYCIASIVLYQNIDGEEIIMALFTYSMTILLINELIPKSKFNKGLNCSEKEKSKVMSVLAGLSGAISDVLIPAAISFVGYMLIGFAFRGDFVYGDMSGLAIAIGGAFSKVLRYNQCEFIV